MDRLSEALIYHKFGDCGWLILEYLTSYRLAMHKVRFSSALLELATITKCIASDLQSFDPYVNPRVYDFCNRGPSVTWGFRKNRDGKWDLRSYIDFAHF